MKKESGFLFKFLPEKITFVLALFFANGYLAVAQNPCPNTTSPNLITNGNFESCITGDSLTDGFAVDYMYTGLTTCPGGEGGFNTTANWSVTTKASTLNGAYANPTGTPGSGNPTPNHYLLVNVDGTANKSAYTTAVNVIPGATYFFSAWMVDINATFFAPPILKFSINGAQVGSLVHVDPDSNSNAWEQFFVTWTAPLTVTNPVSITIENERLVGSGNDLALDNISFTTSCAAITNLNELGKTANLIDTLYECDFSFPTTVISGLPASGYQFAWKNSSYDTLGVANSYTFATAPPTGKYYLCYDTIPGCYRADSFIVSNKIGINLGSTQNLCPPIDYTITSMPTLTAPGLTYSWTYNGAPISGAASGAYQATQDGTYTLTVSAPGCVSNTSSLTITSPTPLLTGTVTCVGGAYQFSATAGTYNAINGTNNVAWYSVPVNGTAFTASPNNVSATVSAANLASAPGCATGGLYAQDLNSYYATLGPATQPCTNVNTINNSSGYMLITVYANVTINSMQIVQQNYNPAITQTYTAQIYSYNGTNTPGSAISAATGPTYTFAGASSASPVIQTLSFGTSGAGYTLTGTPAGTKYWIGVIGSEFAYLNCSATYPYENGPNPGVVELTQQFLYGGSSNNMMAFNIQFTEGTPNPCNRSWVCAGAGCATPVRFLYVNAENSANETTINWATASEQNNAYFVVQKSADGINFTNIDTVAGAGNSSVILTYSYADKSGSDGTSYYRILQVDFNQEYTYSDIVAVTLHNNSAVKIYPVPVKEGADLTVKLGSEEQQTIAVHIVDIVGKEIVQYIRSVQKGDGVFTVPTARLCPGTYLIELFTQNGETTVQRIVVN